MTPGPAGVGLNLAPAQGAAKAVLASYTCEAPAGGGGIEGTGSSASMRSLRSSMVKANAVVVQCYSLSI